MKKLILMIFLFGMGLSFTACQDSSPQIELEITNLDLGEAVNGEIVSRDMLVRNVGQKPLKVETVTTSCGCTSATLKPMVVAPGGTANLHIEVDTGAHGLELTGPLVRQIFIVSNDPDQPEAEVELSVNILPRP